MTSRSLSFLALLGTLFLASCDANSDNSCLTVTPDERYTLSGTATSMDFTPESKTYSVLNTCDTEVMLSVEEDVRWLDVEILAFGGGGIESGILSANTSINVVIEVRYGSDNPLRLDQLAPGTYGAEIRFNDDTNDTSVVRSVGLTVISL